MFCTQVCGLWFVVCGLWFVVCGLWLVVGGWWLVVGGLLWIFCFVQISIDMTRDA